jgi:hypothetical protein
MKNNPIFLKAFGKSSVPELTYHYMAHTVLDVMEEKSTIIIA